MRAPRRPRPSRPARATTLAATLATAHRGLLLLALAALPGCATTRAHAVRDDVRETVRGAVRGDAPEAAPAAASVRQRRTVSSGPDVTLRELKGDALARDPMRPLSDVLASLWALSLRPDPRRALSSTNDADLGVYAGNAYVGGSDFLRTVRSGEVARVERLTRAEAYQRFGRSHANGALLVTFWPGGRR
jgi:hypothetical protein